MSAALISRGSDTNLTGDARLHDSSAPLWNREADSSVEGTQSKVGDGFVLDPAVVRELPKGSKVLSVGYHGAAVWAQSAAVETEQSDGVSRRYFIKFNSTDKGAMMMRGEFESMSAIYKLAPSLTPRPIAIGKSETRSLAAHFYLAEFVELSDHLASPKDFCSQLARLHRDSESPTARFGFHVPTLHGPNIQENRWDDDWARYFTRLMTYFFKLEKEANGPWPELEDAFNRLVEVVIPKVLGPLQSDGRNIKPCLVHGDLWPGNIATNVDTNNPVIFDAAAFYAHNEYEIGTWTCHRLDKRFLEFYKEAFPPSEPDEQWEDRSLLYSLKFLTAHCIGWPGLKLHRQELLADMLYLVQKYEGPDTTVQTIAKPAPEALQKEMRELHPDYTVPAASFSDISTGF